MGRLRMVDDDEPAPDAVHEVGHISRVRVGVVCVCVRHLRGRAGQRGR